jgi:hypothetical protein
LIGQQTHACVNLLATPLTLRMGVFLENIKCVNCKIFEDNI